MSASASVSVSVRVRVRFSVSEAEPTARDVDITERLAFTVGERLAYPVGEQLAYPVGKRLVYPVGEHPPVVGPCPVGHRLVVHRVAGRGVEYSVVEGAVTAPALS